jgi:predicted nucleic acid-binding protein
VRFLLDTNVVSELAKAQPNMSVVRWLHEADEDSLFVSVITVAELRYGVQRLAPGARRERLDGWIREQLTERFEGRLLVVDEEIAETWGQLMAASEAQGRRMSVMGCFLAATAVVHRITLATRNVEDFSGFGGEVFDPWSPA